MLAGTGPTTVFSTGETGERLFGQLPGPLAGTRPPKPPTNPVFRPDLPCEVQEPPDLNTPESPGDSTVRPTPTPPGLPDLTDLLPKDKSGVSIDLIEAHLKAKAKGQPTIDPLEYSEEGRKQQAKQLGLEPQPDGTYKRIKKPEDAR